MSGLSARLAVLYVLVCVYLSVQVADLHKTRNKYNVGPVGDLRRIRQNEYQDESGLRWLKRGFWTSLLHNPFKNYVFETAELDEMSSSEVVILRSEFDDASSEKQRNFYPGSFNYYSSFRYPLAHVLTDVLPVFIF